MTFLEALKTGKAALAVARKADDLLSPQAQFDRSVAQINTEMTQVMYAVCRALVAHALGKEPDSATVNAFLAAAVSDPRFPSRAYRLLGEAKKTNSWRRRVFLASVLYGLPFTRVPEEELERVDMVVERMTVADAELLKALACSRQFPHPDPIVRVRIQCMNCVDDRGPTT